MRVDLRFLSRARFFGGTGDDHAHHGSTSRCERVKMLCRKDGEVVGSVSSGCLEGDIARVSLQVVEQNQPQIIDYDTSSENEKVWGLGLGCNGTVGVFDRASAVVA